MDLRLDIERRKRFSAKEYKQEGDKGSGGSHGPSPEKSSDKAAKHHKKSKYVDLLCSCVPPAFSPSLWCAAHVLCVSHLLSVLHRKSKKRRERSPSSSSSSSPSPDRKSTRLNSSHL